MKTNLEKNEKLGLNKKLVRVVTLAGGCGPHFLIPLSG